MDKHLWDHIQDNNDPQRKYFKHRTTMLKQQQNNWWTKSYKLKIEELSVHHRLTAMAYNWPITSYDNGMLPCHTLVVQKYRRVKRFLPILRYSGNVKSTNGVHSFNNLITGIYLESGSWSTHQWDTIRLGIGDPKNWIDRWYRDSPHIALMAQTIQTSIYNARTAHSDGHFELLWKAGSLEDTLRLYCPHPKENEQTPLSLDHH